MELANRVNQFEKIQNSLNQPIVAINKIDIFISYLLKGNVLRK